MDLVDQTGRGLQRGFGLMTQAASFEPESERVTRQLSDEILDGVRAPGSRLVERDLAAELGVSRLPAVGCPVPGARCPVPGARCGMRGAGCGMRGAGCGVRGAGCAVRGAGCAVRGARCAVRDARCPVPGAGCASGARGGGAGVTPTPAPGRWSASSPPRTSQTSTRSERRSKLWPSGSSRCDEPAAVWNSSAKSWMWNWTSRGIDTTTATREKHVLLGLLQRP
ncbi:GntR family transcriptional regulator [Saccharopolyspora spinosa]|uniref:GntR family transcriptional regulator n=1 Tax=Saccharopolyspora spinosa TaxID=60894 RepID=UPI0030B810F6